MTDLPSEQANRYLRGACGDLTRITQALGINGPYDLTTVLTEIRRLRKAAQLDLLEQA